MILVGPNGEKYNPFQFDFNIKRLTAYQREQLHKLYKNKKPFSLELKSQSIDRIT